MSFEALKKRKKSIEDLVNAARAAQGDKSNDNNVWKLERDKNGNGYAVIRFLPAKNPDDLPWVQYYDHGFKGPTGKWYIEKSRTTIGEDDPVSVYNNKLWNSGVEADKEQVRKQKRRLHYVSNILVISDSANPENEGKVFKFVYGRKIFEKIMEAMSPEFEDETPINVFDFWEGANFKLKVRKVDGWVNYDKSEFEDPSPLFDGDEAKLKEVYESLHDLNTYIDPNTFKSYEELERKLNDVLGLTPSGNKVSVTEKDMEAAAESEAVPSVPDDVPFDTDDNMDDTLSYFAELANS